MVLIRRIKREYKEDKKIQSQPVENKRARPK